MIISTDSVFAAKANTEYSGISGLDYDEDTIAKNMFYDTI